MTIHHNGLFVEPGPGRSYYFGQGLYTFKAVGEETGETYALCEVIVAPSGGTPTHRHPRGNESFYVQTRKFQQLLCPFNPLGEPIFLGRCAYQLLQQMAEMKLTHAQQLS